MYFERWLFLVLVLVIDDNNDEEPGRGVVLLAGMHAPARPEAPGEMAAPGRPGPENFQLCPAPPRPNPEKEGAAPPRPAPKITPGQESWQTFLHHQKFLGVKNF